jgi:hypothetical protein
MSEYHGESIMSGHKHGVRYTASFWDRLFGRAHWIEEVNIRNAYLESKEEDLDLLRQAVNDLQPEKVLEQEGKHLDEIGLLKVRIRDLESELAAYSIQENAREDRRNARAAHFTPEPVLIKPERAQQLGRDVQGRGRGYVAPNSGAHATSGQVGSTPQDGGSGLLMQAAVLHTVLASDSAPTRSEAACHTYRETYSTPEQRAEPAYCAPEPTRSEPSYSSPDSGSYGGDSGGGGGGGCD